MVMMMTLLNQVIQMMRMINLQHVKIICYISSLSSGNFSLLLFRQQVKVFELEFQSNDVDFFQGMLGGWLCFCVSILIIGALTALIGDLAAHVNQLESEGKFLWIMIVVVVAV